jgi:histidine ammonia-lyase
MAKSLISIDGESLTIEDIAEVSRQYTHVEVTKEAIKKIEMSANIVKNVVEEKKKVYGVTTGSTGFGFLQQVTISPEDAQKLQKNLILSHSSGVGSDLPHEVIRGVILLQLNKFARGHSGIRWDVVSLLLELLNRNIIPVVPSKGSLGASGDLAPLAHLSSVLIGFGLADYENKRVSGDEALKLANLKPITLQAKEGLALLNGTQVMTSLAALAVLDSEYLIKIGNISTALSMEIHRANIDFLHPKIHNARPHNGQIQVAEFLLKYLDRSNRIRQNMSFQDCYSLRCVPAVHGATLDTISHVRRVIKTEINSSTDNPLIFSDDQIFSGCNFHGQPIALVMDYLIA